MTRIDFDAWDRLVGDLEAKEGPYAYFAAFEKIMGRWIAETPDEQLADCPIAGAWDHGDITDRIAIFGFACALREWAEAKGRRDAGGEVG